MVNLPPAPPAPPPAPPAAPPPPAWVAIAGAAFGGITLIALLAYLGLAGVFPDFVCNSYILIAFAFALGSALAVAFLGGHAAASGQIGLAAQQNSLTFSAGGGIATLIIMFFLTNYFSPKSCEDRTIKGTYLQLQNIHVAPPGGSREGSYYPYQFLSTFWRRVTSHPDPLNSVARHNVEVLVNEVGRGTLYLYDNSGQICWLEIRVLPSSRPDVFGQDNDYHHPAGMISNPGRNIELTFFKPRRGANQVTNSCFRYGSMNVLARIFVIPTEDKFILLKNSSDPYDADPSHVAQLSDESSPTRFTSLFGRWFSALAAEGKPSFAELRVSLAATDPVRRADARRFLGANFERYAKDALTDLFVRHGHSSEYIVSLLHGLILGIDRAAGSTLKPGTARRLNVDLPYIKGKEKNIVDMTADENYDVQHQARRLIQRYPINAFATIYEPVLKKARDNCGASQPERSVTQDKIYSAIFYYYNRIVQYYYDRDKPATKLGDVQLAEMNNATQLVFPASVCLDREQRADVAVIEYGKAIVFQAYNDMAQARAAAARFLNILEREGAENYYFQGHIEKMRALAARTG